MNLTKIISIVLFLTSVGLGYYLYNDITTTIEQQKALEKLEDEIVEKLSFIRQAEKVYIDQKGKYTSNWDTLKNFINHGKAPIIDRKERVVMLSYGADTSIIRYDTIGYESIRDRIFKETTNINCARDGVFLGFFVKKGENVLENAKSYKIRSNSSGKVEEYQFLIPGTVSELANIEPGTEIGKGDFLITTWRYRFRPDFNVDALNLIPTSDFDFDFGGEDKSLPKGPKEGYQKEFQIYVNNKHYNRNGVPGNVIKVWDPAPINPDRNAPEWDKQTNSWDWDAIESPSDGEEVSRKTITLHFGSTNDASTLGNWE